MKLINKILITFALIVFFILSFVFKAQAQSLSLGIYPPLLEVTMQPGKSITQVYKLYNNGDSDLVMTSFLAPFVPDGDQGYIEIRQDEKPQSLDWISFQNADLQLGQSFALQQNSSQEVVLKIKTPENAQEEDHYFTLVFANDPNYSGLIGSNQSQNQIQIGANIILSISESGEPQHQAQISEFKLTNGFANIFLDSFTKPEFILKVKNTGPSFFKPLGNIKIKNPLGGTYILDLLPENVLTNSTRQISCQINEEAAKCSLPSKFLLGYYQAQVSFDLDKPGEEYQKEIFFLAFPWKITTVIIVIIGIGLFTIKKAKKTIDKGF